MRSVYRGKRRDLSVDYQTIRSECMALLWQATAFSTLEDTAWPHSVMHDRILSHHTTCYRAWDRPTTARAACNISINMLVSKSRFSSSTSSRLLIEFVHACSLTTDELLFELCRAFLRAPVSLSKLTPPASMISTMFDLRPQQNDVKAF